MQETQETWVQSLGEEDFLEEEMATHSHILAWRIPWTEEPGGLLSMGLQRLGQDWVTKNTQVATSLLHKSFLINKTLKTIYKLAW